MTEIDEKLDKVKQFIAYQQWENAERLLNELSNNYEEKQEQIFNLKGVIALEKGQYDPAITHFMDALVIDDQYTKAIYNLGLTYYKKGNFTEAEKFYRKCLNAKKNHNEMDQLYNNIALVKMGKGDFNEATEYLEKAMEINNENISVIYNYTRLLHHKNEFTKAVKILENGIELIKAQNTEINTEIAMNMHYLNAVLMENLGNEKKAREEYQSALKLNENNHSILNDAAIFEVKKENYKQALEYLTKAVKIKPKDLDSLINLGYVHHIMGKHEESIRIYEKVVQIEKHNAEIWYYLLENYEKLDDKQKIKETFDSMVRYFATDYDVLKDAGFYFIDIEIEKAEKYLKSALDIEPESIEVPHYLGILYNKKADQAETIQNKKENALKSLEYYDQALDYSENRSEEVDFNEIANDKKQLLDKYQSFFS